ncbi:flagellar hook-associated protein FlgK [Rhizobium leguminosarum]|uniref:Flagellar hook-associated protein 1 n=2 Tax=Rhizobium leguminosarum TaxID=384 RepID=A0A1B8RDG9_RHILT|nr:flagellar hook-associated protein FlgK [Rhizobium leguminosarum]AOO90375.1 flagellar hook-associated protein FlgK [Rhizobium leguminosarum bv. trifolii]ASS54414.1 flagellar hook-associated protein FlgK [Rhizobium leguminosarum bv. viciae]AVC48291.1 flagellar hook-associated protein FlgK [Rhizobium leguminosarum bv. viciae]MBA9031355.1 flagellar hook-associated protein 1 FlgK [Rhizobium leguminosarum]MBB4330334.1 flagellar hook-associated protein 1 FlgK [Rhizobium leguminosarum]
MSLTSALNTAQSIFNNTGTQSSVVSNNISNAGNKDYVRRQAMLTTSLNGAQVVKIDRAQEDALLRQYLKTSSQDSAQQALLGGLEDLKSIMGGNDYETSPSTYLGVFQQKLQAFRTAPGSTVAAQGAITAAQDVANSLNNASQSVQDVRATADKQIATDVDKLNSLLSDFEKANNAVKTATASGADASGALDEREKALKQISQIVGVNATTRDNNDMVLSTSDGTILFETVPRKVTFKSQDIYTATITGNSVYVDGVALPRGSGSTTTGQGSLQSLLQVRDEIAPNFQKQLDEIARGLVSLFKEQSTSGTPAYVPGLFTWSGGTVDTGSAAVAGMASTISVSSTVITSQGGDPMRLRDGGVNANGVVNNPTHLSGYTTDLDRLYTALGSDIDFDPAAGPAVGFDATTGIDSNVSIMEYATNSLGWLEQYRSNATTAAENTSAALSRSDEAYSNETGVNLDEELTLLLDIEQSYKAATKILNAVDEMLKSLLDIAS